MQRPIFRRQSGQDASNFDLAMQLASTNNPTNLMKEFLLPHFKRLCREPDGPVRTHVAAVFHEFAQSLKNDAASLIDSFIDLSYSNDPEVIGHLASHLEEILECVYDTSKETSIDSSEISKNFQSPQLHAAHARLLRTLISCNRVVRNGSQWRFHEQLLISFGCLIRFLSNEEMCQMFLPLMKDEVLTARALPCRLAALKTIIIWMKSLPYKDTQRLVDFFKHSLAHNRSCHKRVLFLEACEMAIEFISNEFFKQHLYFSAMQMGKDPVLNIRIKVCKLLPLFKRALILPMDGDHMIAMESALRSLTKAETKGYMEELLKKTIKELAQLDSVAYATPSGVNFPSQPVSNSCQNGNSTAAAVTKNSSAPLPPRTFPAALKAMSIIKDGLSAQFKNKPAEETENKDIMSMVKTSPAEMANGKPPLYTVHKSASTAATAPTSMANHASPISSGARIEPVPIHSSAPKTGLYGSLTTNGDSHVAVSAVSQNGFIQNGFAKNPNKLAELFQFKPISNRKVAVIHPHQVVTRSPSPLPKSHPPLGQYDNVPEPDEKLNNDGSLYSAAGPILLNGNLPPKSSNIDSKFRWFWSKPPFTPATTLEQKSDYGERIVPIKVVATKSLPEYDWSNSRPPTPATFRLLSAPSQHMDSMNKSTIDPSRIRHIPVVRTGVVMRSVEMLENSGAVAGVM